MRICVAKKEKKKRGKKELWATLESTKALKKKFKKNQKDFDVELSGTTATLEPNWVIYAKVRRYFLSANHLDLLRQLWAHQ